MFCVAGPGIVAVGRIRYEVVLVAAPAETRVRNRRGALVPARAGRVRDLAGRRADRRGLELVGVSKRFGEIVALDGVCLDIRPGRLVGFLGPNGAGKTTAMRAVFGLIEPDAGKVLWGGRPVGIAERLRFGYRRSSRRRTGPTLPFIRRSSDALMKDFDAFSTS
jgi:ABC-type glutathione transport system ATPase component